MVPVGPSVEYAERAPGEGGSALEELLGRALEPAAAPELEDTLPDAYLLRDMGEHHPGVDPSLAELTRKMLGPNSDETIAVAALRGLVFELSALADAGGPKALEPSPGLRAALRLLADRAEAAADFQELLTPSAE